MGSQLCIEHAGRARWLRFLLAIGTLTPLAVLLPGAVHALTRIQLAPTGPGGSGDEMGSAVALMGDLGAVGAPNTQITYGVFSGTVDVIRREGTVWQTEALLSPADAVTGMGFGYAVAVAPDLVVVGASMGKLYTFENDGSAWAQVDAIPAAVSKDISLSGDTLLSAGVVYVRDGDGWQPQATLPADPNEYFYNGAIDGDLAAVISGSSPFKGGFQQQGYVYFFSRSGATWTREAKFDLGLVRSSSHIAISGRTAIVSVTPTDRSSVRVFGRDDSGAWSDQGILDAGADFYGETPLALEGDVAVVGSYGDGTAYTFVRSGGVWTRNQHFTDPTYPFGCFVAVALSGSDMLAGCPGAITSSGGYGKADLFSLDSDPPPVVAEFDQGNAHLGETFGQGVALSGSTLLAGAQDHAYVFEQSDSGWVEQALLSPALNLSTDVAISLALDGDTAALAYRGSPNTEGVDIHVRTADTWALQTTLSSGSTGNHYFGWALALQGDSLAIGQPETLNGFPTDIAGNCHIFERSGADWSEQAVIQPADGSIGDEFCFAVALSGDTLLVGAPRSDNGIETDSGAAYVFTRSGTIWTQQARLVAPLVATHAGFGVSVALKGDTAVIGAGQDLPADSDRGAAYVFTRSGDVWTWQATLTPPVAPTPYTYGRWVALSDAGDKALVSAPYGLVGSSGLGVVFSFAYDGGQWSSGPILQGSPPATQVGYDYFGTGVSFSGDDFAIGAPYDGPGGAVYQGTLSQTIFVDGFDASP